MNYPHGICKAAFYIIEIRLFSLHPLVLLKTVYITKIHTKPQWHVEQYVQQWMTCTAFNDLYYAEWFVQRVWMVCTLLDDLNYVEWFKNKWF